MPYWSADWLWSLPLVLLTVVIHAYATGTVREAGVTVLRRVAGRPGFHLWYSVVLGGAVMAMTILHALEAAIWGVVYLSVGAVPDAPSAMIYSLSAMTTYGNSGLDLAQHWRLMGAVEALNGIVLFGFTVATLFSIMDSRTAPVD